MKRVALIAAIVAFAPAAPVLAEPDPLYPVLQVGDLVAGSQQASEIEGADRTQPFGAHPGLLPDWNHDGVFGNEADYVIENSTRDAAGPFRYPCIAITGEITYQTTKGTCVRGDTHNVRFRTGEARKLRVVDSVGWELQAAVFLPREALDDRDTKLPGVVFANGAQAAMQTFYMYTMTLALQGIIVLNFDFAGQGQSEDSSFFNTYAADQGSVGGDCHVARSCRETQDMVRWFTGADIVRVPSQSPGTHNPAYAPKGDNSRNPVLSLVDTSRVGIMGQSMGALTVSTYLWYLPTGKGIDGRPLPPIRAAVGLSGFTPPARWFPISCRPRTWISPDATSATSPSASRTGPSERRRTTTTCAATGKAAARSSSLCSRAGATATRPTPRGGTTWGRRTPFGPGP